MKSEKESVFQSENISSSNRSNDSSSDSEGEVEEEKVENPETQ